MSDPLNHLGSIWYHSEPSDVPYSKNLLRPISWFGLFLQQNDSKWTNEITKINRVIQKTVLLENRVSGGVPVYLKIRGILDVQGSQLKISPFFSCPNALLSRSFSVFIVLEIYNFACTNDGNVVNSFHFLDRYLVGRLCSMFTAAMS